MRDRRERQPGRGQPDRQRRARAGGHEHRAPCAEQPPRRLAHEPDERRGLDRHACAEDDQLAATVVARAVELIGGEVRSRVDRRGRDDAVTRPQQEHRSLGNDEGGGDGHGNPAGALHVVKNARPGP
jgi:hypothetical protein